MTNPEAQQRCKACEHWSKVLFDIQVDTERIEFAESRLVPDPREILAQHIAHHAKTGLCKDCMLLELEVLKEKPDHANIMVSWPSNGGPNT
jgi:hypothetical protein